MMISFPWITLPVLQSSLPRLRASITSQVSSLTAEVSSLGSQLLGQLEHHRDRSLAALRTQEVAVLKMQLQLSLPPGPLQEESLTDLGILEEQAAASFHPSEVRLQLGTLLLGDWGAQTGRAGGLGPNIKEDSLEEDKEVPMQLMDCHGAAGHEGRVEKLEDISTLKPWCISKKIIEKDILNSNNDNIHMKEDRVNQLTNNNSSVDRSEQLPPRLHGGGRLV